MTDADDARVLIRPPERRDMVARARAGQHPEIAAGVGRVVGKLGPLTAAQAYDWYRLLHEESDVVWVITVNGRPVGQVALHSVNAEDGRARLAIGLWRPEDLGRGYGSAAIRQVLQHAFTKMDLHRVDLRVLAFNGRAIAAYKRCGFTEEGREREACWFGARWHDDVMMSILCREWAAGT